MGEKMKAIAVMVVVVSAIGCSAQTTKSVVTQTANSLDWRPCQKDIELLRLKVNELQYVLPDGFRLVLSCDYVGTAKENIKLPEKHVSLTAKEADTLEYLRSMANAAFSAQSSYENLMIRKYVPNARKGFDDPCYYYVGFVMDTNFITVDPNPLSPWMCKQKEK